MSVTMPAPTVRFEVPYRLVIAALICSTIYVWIELGTGLHEGVRGDWATKLGSSALDFETYWMKLLYTEFILEMSTAGILWGWLWKTRDRNLAAITPQEELRRNIIHLIWLFAYVWTIYWGTSYFTDVSDTDLTPNHIIAFYLSYPVCIISGISAFLYAKTRLPLFAQGVSLFYMVMLVGPLMLLPNVGLNEWGHTFWFMEELFIAPAHYGVVIFVWLALGIGGILLQVSPGFSNLMGLARDVSPLSKLLFLIVPPLVILFTILVHFLNAKFISLQPLQSDVVLGTVFVLLAVLYTEYVSTSLIKKASKLEYSRLKSTHWLGGVILYIELILLCFLTVFYLA